MLIIVIEESNKSLRQRRTPYDGRNKIERQGGASYHAKGVYKVPDNACTPKN